MLGDLGDRDPVELGSGEDLLHNVRSETVQGKGSRDIRWPVTEFLREIRNVVRLAVHQHIHSLTRLLDRPEKRGLLHPFRAWRTDHHMRCPSIRLESITIVSLIEPSSMTSCSATGYSTGLSHAPG